MGIIKITMPPPKPRVNKKTGKEEPGALYTGVRAGVTFTGGVGYTEDELNSGQWFNFKRWGYKVEGATEPEWDANGNAVKPVDRSAAEKQPESAKPDKGGK